MKKLIKVVGIFMAALIAFMIILPMFFKGKIAELAKSEANKMLDAKFDFKDLSISFFSSFPLASIDIDDISIVGNVPFEGDTLLYANRIRAAIDVRSLFGDSGIRIREILLEDPYINGIVADSLHSNWNIMKDNGETDNVDKEPESSNFSLKLEQFRISGGRVRYTDMPGKINASMSNLDVNLSGDMSADNTDIDSEINIGSMTCIMDGVPYLSSARIYVRADIDADIKNSKYTFRKNTFALNSIETSVDGWISMPDNQKTEMDISLNTSNVNFKDILSLVPAIYAKEFESLKADGVVSLTAWAKGVMSGDTLPAFETSLKVDGGMFKYPSLPESVTNINVYAVASSQGGDANQIKADVKYFSFVIGGAPFKFTLSASELAGDMKFAATADGTIDLQKISQVYPVGDSLSLNGIITADAKISGRMSQIENEEYEKISAEGDIKVKDVNISQKDSPDIQVSQAELEFTPKYVLLKTFDAKMGQSDIHVDGRLENFIAYALKDATIKGNLNVSSNYINVNQFLSEEPQKEQETVKRDSVPASSPQDGIVEVPKNIDFVMNVAFNKIDMDKMSLTDMKGKATVKDGIARLNGLVFNAFEGKVTANGTYDTSVAQKAVADMAFAVDKASFKSTFESVESLKKMAPVFENMTGNYTMNLNVRTDIGKDLTPELNTLTGSGNIKSNSVTISGVAALDKLADAISYPALKNISPKDMNISFTITDGRITTKPFDLTMGANKLTLHGSTGLDQTIDYDGTVTLGTGINLGGVNINNIPLEIKGTFSSPKVSIDTKSAASSVVKDLGKQVLEKAGISDSSQEELKQKADSIYKEHKQEIKEKAGNALKDAAKKLFK